MNAVEYEIHIKEKSILDTHNLVKREEGTPRSCSDPLSFASFLAFALAVSNLMMGRKRKRRSTDICQHKEWSQNSTQATSSVIAAILSTQNMLDKDCRTQAHCQAGRELSRLGKVGSLIAEGSQLLGNSVHNSIQVFTLTISTTR